MLRLSMFVVLLALAVSPVRAGLLWDDNWSGATGGVIANTVGIDEAQFLGSSILGFHDNDASGGISTGDTFKDYVVLRIKGFTDIGGNDITPAGYGAGPGVKTHELTVVTELSGIQTGNNTYAITSIDSYKMYADFGAGFSKSNFFDLSTFTNTPLVGAVETGVLGGPSGGNNTGPTRPDGTIDVVVKLNDMLHTYAGTLGKYFELFSAGPNAGQPLDQSPSVVLQGLFDANNLLTPPGGPLGGLTTGSTVNSNLVVSGFDTLFGLSGVQAANGAIVSLTGFDFGFQTRSDGSFVKAVVPEPSSVAVFGGIGLLLALRRRRRNAA